MVRFIPYRVCSGEDNMRIDNELLEKAIADKSEEPVFRLYGWKPACISLGKNQSDSFIDKQFLKDTGIDLVRRHTGGRALLHDNEITYSYICPVDYLNHGENVVKSYIEISQILIDKFRKMGIELDFGGGKKVNTKFDYCMLISTGADLCYRGKKLIGSAQCRKQGYILQHGSILYDYDKELLEKIFHETVDTSEITSIKEINPDITKEDLIEVLSC
jgi:lipoate-protein ligase A